MTSLEGLVFKKKLERLLLESKALKIAIIGGFVIFLFLGFEKELEDFFFFEMTKNSNLAALPLPKSLDHYKEFRPWRDWRVPDLQLEAKAAYAIAISPQGPQKILFKKNSEQALPIASLTKLMTSLIAFENYDLELPIEISEAAARASGDSNHLRAGEVFYSRDLLYALLLESSNVASRALAEKMGSQEFVVLMNNKAHGLGLKNTYFSNVTGLDPESNQKANYSTAQDLAVLASFLVKEPLFQEILKTKEFDLYTSQNTFHHKIQNTNELLKEIPGIIGGKTGTTTLAKECLLIIINGPKNDSVLINVVLGSDNRFEEMKKLLDWINQAYKW